MRTLWLHVGQLKAGSSYLQSVFALSAEVLAARGIIYPTNYPEHAAARRGMHTQGNGRMLVRTLDDLDSGLQVPNEGDLMVSFEGLHKYLAGPSALTLFAFMARHRFERLSCLLMVRDPVDHATSSARHAIAHGLVESVEEGFENFHAPLLAAGFIARMVVRGGRRPELVVRNYSRVCDHIRAVAAEWLKVPAQTLAKPPVRIVHPSRGVLRYPDLACQRAMLARMDAPIVGVNRWLPMGEQYRCRLRDPETGAEIPA